MGKLRVTVELIVTKEFHNKTSQLNPAHARCLAGAWSSL